MTLKFDIKSITPIEDEGGGGDTIRNQNKTVTENGTYTADSGYTGLGTVTVDVPQEETTLITKSITENGNYNATDDNADGYSSINVNVPSPTINLQEKTVTENGEVIPDSGYNGLSKVTVSVSGGGGGESSETVVRGNWVVPQAYLDLEKAVENYDYIDTLTQDRYIVGFVIPPNTKDVYIPNVGTLKGKIITSDGDIIDPVNNLHYEFKDKSKCNWFIVMQNMNVYSYTIPVYFTNGVTPQEYGERRFKYVVIRHSNTTYPVDEDGYRYLVDDKYADADAVKLINIISTGGMKYGELRNSKRQYIYDMTNYTRNAFDDDVSDFNAYAHLAPNLPYGLDLSNKTQAITIGQSSYENRLKQAYITLPNANFTLNNIVFTKDNWQYIAEHAPTVSGKKLVMGTYNINICGGSDSEIITTLTNKGWQVS